MVIEYTIKLLDESWLLDGVHLISNEWGREYSAYFLNEMTHLLKTPYAVLLGAVNQENELCGITVINKAEMDFAYWSITWVLVSPECRSLGLGKRLVQAAETHAVSDRVNYPVGSSKRLVIQLTTSSPAFYEKLGYRRIFDDLMVKNIEPEFWSEKKDAEVA